MQQCFAISKRVLLLAALGDAAILDGAGTQIQTHAHEVDAVIHRRSDSLGAGAKRHAVSSRHQALDGDHDEDDYPACSCDCCDTVPRLPEEIVGNVAVKCSPSEGHSTDMCDQMCAPSPRDHLLGMAAEAMALDYLRFCLYECKPAKGVISPIHTQCIDLDGEDVRRVEDRTGNAVDPEIIYGQPVVMQGGRTFLVRPQAPPPPPETRVYALLSNSELRQPQHTRGAVPDLPEEVLHGEKAAGRDLEAWLRAANGKAPRQDDGRRGVAPVDPTSSWLKRDKAELRPAE